MKSVKQIILNNKHKKSTTEKKMNSVLMLCGLFVIHLAVSDSFKLFRSERSNDAIPSECLTLPEFGTCGSPVYHNNYYFDLSSGKCKKFVYNYCEDHGNNFWLLRDCISTCQGEDSVEYEDYTTEEETYENDCEYPPETGMCRAAFRNYFFDGEKCVEFIYGGCGGNPNNFPTKEDCEKKCMPDDNGVDAFTLLRNEPDSIPRKNQEIFSIVQEDNSIPSRCLTLPDFGTCGSLGYHNNYYFDVSSGKCKKFLYNICEDYTDNDNNFRFLHDCITTCTKYEGDGAEYEEYTIEEETYENECEYPPETGRCPDTEKAFLYYFFDGEKCVEFIYLGCGGTPNNFPTKEDCMKKCMPDDNGVGASEIESENESQENEI